MRILIIDDNRDFADALQRLLRFGGYEEVYTAYGGAAGIACAQKINPDFILIDLQMPEIDGFSVIRELRTSVVPFSTFVAITGYGQASDKDQTREASFNFHLTKPFGFAELRDILGISESAAA